jgi:hypothetical protein
MNEEKELETQLCQKLNGGSSATSKLRLNRSTSDATTVADLIRDVPFELFKDNSDWNQDKRLLADLCGSTIPDIVLRSKVSGENRIYIEVKKDHKLGYGLEDSQVVRYFLHLLATTLQDSKKGKDIRRALILAAPPSWFSASKNNEAWSYFLTTYTKLANHFDITLAELHL